MKQNSSFTSFLVFLIAVILFTITSMLMTSCTGVRYAYFNKQKVPYTASEEIKSAKAIPTQPYLNQVKNELKEAPSSTVGKNSNQKNIAPDNDKQKVSTPTKFLQDFTEKNIAKYIPKQDKGIQSGSNTNEDRTLMIVLLVVLILVVISLLGDGLIWLLFLALLVLLIYALIKYLGIFN